MKRWFSPDTSSKNLEDTLQTSSFARTLRNVAVAGMIGLASMYGCSDDNPVNGGNGGEPDPDPVNSAMSINAQIPGDYRWDEPKEHRFRVIDQDGFSEGFVRFYQQEEGLDAKLVWEKNMALVDGVRWDTTWTPRPFPADASLDSRGESWIEYEIVDDFSGEKEIRSGTQSSLIRPSRFTEFDLRVESFREGVGLDGSVTFPGWRTVDGEGGLFRVTRDLEIDRDSLEAGLYRIVGEFTNHPDTSSDYFTHSSQLRASDDGVRPVRVAVYDPELLYPSRDSAHEDESLITRRVDKKIINWLYNESAAIRDGNRWSFESTDDKTLVAPKGFYDEVEHYLNDAVSWITDVSGVTVEHRRESTSEEHFPRTLVIDEEKVYFFNAGSPDARFALEQATSVHNGYVIRARLFKRTGFEQSEFSWPDAIAREMAEQLGIPTSGSYGLKIADKSKYDSIWTPEAPFILKRQYSRPAQSGIVTLKGQGFENSSGTYTNSFDDWVSDW